MASANKVEGRSIPSLDGLRAISIALVVALHTTQRYGVGHSMNKAWLYVFNGALGVRIFFVISGYLITRLLLREQEQTGRISLGRFYVRRAFRILPPLYVYLVFLCVLGAMEMLQIDAKGIVAAALFLRNYAYHLPAIWALEHTWSLCIEEQFYLIWPAALVLALARWSGPIGRVRAAKIALVAIVVSPLVRTASYALPSTYFHNMGMFHMQADPLMWGCVAALLEGHARWERIYAAVTRWWWLPMLLVYGFSGFMTMLLLNKWSLPLGITMDGFLLSMIVVWCVRNPQSLPGRILNWSFVRWIGTLSYSIYLWQTFFLHEGSVKVFGGERWFNTFPGNWAVILTIAVASFYLVEQPSLRLRSRVMRRRSPV
jgi:peptidoglycan/LPS O-acetylase OafA/YrhL